jgi:WhiB family transcriptional regulator, redox-sensing transcriptional regulator
VNRIAPRDTRSSQRATDWRTFAACRKEDPELFFPLPGEAGKIAAAKRICGSCPVRRACLADALAMEGGRSGESRHGVRGGLGPSGRRNRYEQMRKRQQRAAA